MSTCENYEIGLLGEDHAVNKGRGIEVGATSELFGEDIQTRS